MKILCLGIMLAATIPAAATAQSKIERRYSASFRECMDAAIGVNVEMHDCLTTEANLQDGRINQAYVMVMRSLAPAKKMVLRRSERAWIVQRERNCARAASKFEGGSGYGTAYYSCYIYETIKQTIVLENYNN